MLTSWMGLEWRVPWVQQRGQGGYNGCGIWAVRRTPEDSAGQGVEKEARIHSLQIARMELVRQKESS